MIICVCQSVSERCIRAAIEAGAHSFADLQSECGVALCCGKCTDAVCSLLAEHGRDAVVPLQFCPRQAA